MSLLIIMRLIVIDEVSHEVDDDLLPKVECVPEAPNAIDCDF